MMDPFNIPTTGGPLVERAAPGRPKGGKSRDRVAGELARMILSRATPAGSALPVEAELCTRFGVSRTVLREAVRTLAAKGLVETRQRGGTVVRSPEHWSRLDVEVLAWMNEIEPDIDFVRGIIEARLVIEPAAAALAAERASARDLALIEMALEQMYSASTDDLEACVEADKLFHTGILLASGNPVFAQLAHMIGAALLNSFRLTSSATTAFQVTLDAHREVLEAIRLRRAQAARSAMEGLLGIASRELAEVPQLRLKVQRPGANGRAVMDEPVADAAGSTGRSSRPRAAASGE
jgi:GntR family transcriptional regulator, galactonate operon transcriptional repressor